MPLEWHSSKLGTSWAAGSTCPEISFDHSSSLWFTPVPHIFRQSHPAQLGQCCHGLYSAPKLTQDQPYWIHTQNTQSLCISEPPHLGRCHTGAPVFVLPLCRVVQATGNNIRKAGGKEYIKQVVLAGHSWRSPSWWGSSEHQETCQPT